MDQHASIQPHDTEHQNAWRHFSKSKVSSNESSSTMTHQPQQHTHHHPEDYFSFHQDYCHCRHRSSCRNPDIRKIVVRLQVRHRGRRDRNMSSHDNHNIGKTLDVNIPTCDTVCSSRSCGMSDHQTTSIHQH